MLQPLLSDAADFLSALLARSCPSQQPDIAFAKFTAAMSAPWPRKVQTDGVSHLGFQPHQQLYESGNDCKALAYQQYCDLFWASGLLRDARQLPFRSYDPRSTRRYVTSVAENPRTPSAGATVIRPRNSNRDRSIVRKVSCTGNARLCQCLGDLSSRL